LPKAAQAIGTSKPRGYWQDIHHRKAFFSEFASEIGFDPLDPQAWLKIELNQVLSKKV